MDVRRTKGYLKAKQKALDGARLTVLDRDGHRCVVCGATVKLQMAHIVPLRWTLRREAESVQNHIESTRENIKRLRENRHQGIGNAPPDFLSLFGGDGILWWKENEFKWYAMNELELRLTRKLLWRMLNDDRNLLTLCMRCHWRFDRGNRSIRAIVYRYIASKGLLDYVERLEGIFLFGLREAEEAAWEATFGQKSLFEMIVLKQ